MIADRAAPFYAGATLPLPQAVPAQIPAALSPRVRPSTFASQRDTSPEAGDRA